MYVSPVTMVVSLPRAPHWCDEPEPHSFTCGCCNTVQRLPACRTCLAGKQKHVAAELQDRGEAKTLLGSEWYSGSYILRLYYCLASLENSNLHVIFTCGAYKYCQVGPIYWYSSFLLFITESLWRAVFNSATGPCKAQINNSHGPQLTKASLRRTASPQRSVALGFCPCPVLRGTWPLPICGRNADGHRLISQARSCILSLGQKSWSRCFTKPWIYPLPGDFGIPSRSHTFVWGFNTGWFQLT